MKSEFVNFIKGLVPTIILYTIIKLLFHTSHLQTFIIVVLLLVAISRVVKLIEILIDSEISKHKNE